MTEPTTWDWLGPIISGAVGGGALTVAFQEGLNWVRRPKLVIHFEDKSEYCCHSPFFIPQDNGPPTEDKAIYLRIKVTNEGRAVAKSCRAFIAYVKREDPNGSKDDISGQDSLQMIWSLRPNEPVIDIPKGVNQFADICATLKSEEPSRLHAQVRGLPLRLEQAWTKPGRFEIGIMVTADGVNPVMKTIRFSWNGTWDSLKAIW